MHFVIKKRLGEVAILTCLSFMHSVCATLCVSRYASRGSYHAQMFHLCSSAVFALLCVIMLTFKLREVTLLTSSMHADSALQSVPCCELAFKLRKVTLLTCIMHAECTMLCVSKEVEGSTYHT